MKFYINKALIIILIVLAQHTLYAQKTILPQQNDRWSIQHNGSITWDIKDRLPHADHIEMSGEKVSLWIAYSVDTSGISKITRTVVFPTFRMLPDDTRSHIAYTFEDNELPRIYVNNQLLRFDISGKNESGGVAYQLKSINQHGIMCMSAEAGNPSMVKIERSLFPSVNKPLAIERFKFTNISNKPVTVSMENLKREVTTDTLRSKSAPHTVIMESVNDGSRVLQPGQSTAFTVCYRATDHPLSPVSISPETEEKPGLIELPKSCRHCS